MSLVIASILGLCAFKILDRKSDEFNEFCPAPFFGNDELADAFAKAFENKK